MKSIIYIDNKIHEAIDQLVKYFQDSIFDINKHEVLFKFYPTIRRESEADVRDYYRKTIFERDSDKIETHRSWVKPIE